jgi:hypothetical protein
MIIGKWTVVIDCVNQDTGKWHKKGSTITQLSEGEYGRLMAFKNIETTKAVEKKENAPVRKKLRAKRQRVL